MYKKVHVKKSLEEESLTQFRVALLLAILLSAFVGSLAIALLGSYGFLLFGTLYHISLYIYALVMGALYVLVKKDIRYYRLATHMGVYMSLLLFTLMLLTIRQDELRLIWFFIVAFSAFILGRKRFGFMITLLIVVVVSALFVYGDIGLSWYGYLTFLTSLSMFTLFAFYFVGKVEDDSRLLKHRVEEEVAKQQAQEQMMLRKYRMASMGEMIDAIAHQWRQPLMQGNMHLLNMDDLLDEQEVDTIALREETKALVALHRHMSQTIDDFRTLLTEEKDKVFVNIQEVIDEVLSLMKQRLREINIQITVSKNIQLFTYKNELIQVLIILLSNSAEALENKNIHTQNISINVLEEEEKITLCIADNAGGISPDIISHIFDPYFTTKEAKGGSGLGLYIVKVIVEEHMQGTVECVNQKEGAQFCVKFNIEDKG